MRIEILAVVLIFVPFLSAAQTAQGPRSNLELRLIPGELRNQVPGEFTVELVNVSDHDVRVPLPLVDCHSDFTGYVWLRIVFTRPGADGTEVGYGCAADKDGWPPILLRVKDWKLLHPGDVAKETISQALLHYGGKHPGKYDFWAEYHPPAIEPGDRKILREAGIDFPHESLGSKHLIYQK